MTVTRDDARAALRDAEAAGERSQTLFRYELSSPYLLLWGALWIVAGVVAALSPANTGFGWAAVDFVGLGGTAYLIVRHARRCGTGDERVRLVRNIGSVAALAAFVGLTLMLFGPVAGGDVTMLIALVMAAGYAVAGCWIGVRYAAVGVALAGLCAGVFHLAPAQVPVIVPIAGGGALILGGIWFRRSR